jgi:hypothetical protein
MWMRSLSASVLVVPGREAGRQGEGKVAVSIGFGNAGGV